MYLLLQTMHVAIDFSQLLKSDKGDDGRWRSADQCRSQAFEHPSSAFVLECTLQHNRHAVS